MCMRVFIDKQGELAILLGKCGIWDCHESICLTSSSFCARAPATLHAWSTNQGRRQSKTFQPHIGCLCLLVRRSIRYCMHSPNKPAKQNGKWQKTLDTQPILYSTTNQSTRKAASDNRNNNDIHTLPEVYWKKSDCMGGII